MCTPPPPPPPAPGKGGGKPVPGASPPLVPRRYRLAGLPGEHQQRNITSPEVNYCLVTELIVWTQYEIQVAAYNGAGLGVFSRAVTEYTLQGGELACPPRCGVFAGERGLPSMAGAAGNKNPGPGPLLHANSPPVLTRQ